MEERIYTINLGKRLLKVSRQEKSKKAIRTIRNFLKKHMKSERIKLDKSITENVWKSGDQKPPNKIRIKATKDDEGIVKAELWTLVSPETK